MLEFLNNPIVAGVIKSAIVILALLFVIVCAGVWVLRVRRPELPRPFKTPMVPLVPILGILVSLALMAALPGQTWLRLIVWLIIGMIIYFGYGQKHSRVQQYLLKEKSGRSVVR